MKDFHCKNSKCRAVVGKTDGVNVILDGVNFPPELLYFAVNCPKCEEKIVWERVGYRKLLRENKKRVKLPITIY